MTRPNKLTPGSNLRWEGSRMFLPEHREQLLERKREQKKKVKPDLDEDQLAEIHRVIAESLHSKTEITLTIYDQYENIGLTGYVVRIDQYRGRALLQTDEGDEWIMLHNIINAELEERICD